MIAPRAPHTAEPFGYSWRPPQPGTFGRPSLDQLLPAAEALIRLVDEYQASAKIEASPERRRRIDVMGFSQGAAMSNVLAMLYPQRIRKIGILAGFVPGGLDVYIKQRPLAGKTIFVTHGTKDEMVPIDRARASMELLEQAGAKITYCEDEVGHKVSLNCMKALRSYFED
jgi:phospholipase/carboxylesterase